MAGAKRWYVVQVYTGYEDVVRAELLGRMKEDSELVDLFGEVVMPTGDIIDRLMGGDESRKEKIFPGYLLVQMILTPETRRLVLETPRVGRFLGGESPGALGEKEVERIFAQISGELSVADKGESFSVGSEVHIIGGPFSGFVGMVESLDEEHERATIMVSIFGRMTPVELGFRQIKH